MSSQEVNLYNNFKYKQSFTSQDPTMQGNETLQQASQVAGTGYVGNRINASKDANPLTTLGLTTAIGYGIGQGMDYYGPKCEGKYEKTILGKLGAWGDKFSNDTKVGRFIEKSLRKIEVNWYKLSKKSRTVYALRNHSTRPEWSFAKMPFHGLHGFLSMDTHSVMEEYVKPIANRERRLFGIIPRSNVNDFAKLEQYGLSENAIKAFKNSLSGKPFMEQAHALQLKELELLEATPAQIASKANLSELQELAKELKITKKLGFNSVSEFTKVMENIVEHPKEVMAALERATVGGKDLHISINRSIGTLGKIKSHFLGRKVSLSEYLNKYKATLGKGNKTHLGKALPKALGWLTEGCTNRFAGGKLAPFMQAAIFADMAYHTFKAPKGEKGKTLAERFVNDFSYFIAMTLGLIGIHKVGGWKYLGTDNAGREAYRAAQAAVNATNKVKGYATKKLHKEAIKGVNELLNTKSLKWYQKVMQKIGCIVNMGNEHFSAYLSPSKANLNFLRKIANTNLIGVPLRIWLGMAVITPVIVKATTKMAHLIFGRPTQSVLDEEEEENNENHEAIQSPTSQNLEQNQNEIVNPNNLPDTNLIKETINNQNTGNQNGIINNPANNTQINKDNGEMEPIRTYIPSPISMVNQGLNPDAANMAMANADKAEQDIANIMANIRKS